MRNFKYICTLSHEALYANVEDIADAVKSMNDADLLNDIDESLSVEEHAVILIDHSPTIMDNCNSIVPCSLIQLITDEESPEIQSDAELLDWLSSIKRDGTSADCPVQLSSDFDLLDFMKYLRGC